MKAYSSRSIIAPYTNLVAPVSAEGEGDDRQLVLALEVIHKGEPDTLLLLGTYPVLHTLGAVLLLALRLPLLLGLNCLPAHRFITFIKRRV
jgi:hypothetical protein